MGRRQILLDSRTVVSYFLLSFLIALCLGELVINPHQQQPPQPPPHQQTQQQHHHHQQQQQPQHYSMVSNGIPYYQPQHPPLPAPQPQAQMMPPTSQNFTPPRGSPQHHQMGQGGPGSPLPMAVSSVPIMSPSTMADSGSPQSQTRERSPHGGSVAMPAVMQGEMHIFTQVSSLLSNLTPSIFIAQKCFIFIFLWSLDTWRCFYRYCNTIV